MFNDLLKLKDAPLQETFEKVSIHGKKFIAIKYDGRTIGLANKDTEYPLSSPYLNDTPVKGIIDAVHHAFSAEIVPESVKDVVMYVRGLMVEV